MTAPTEQPAPGGVPVADTIAVFNRATDACLGTCGHPSSYQDCCTAAGLAAVAPLIAAQVCAELAAAGRLLPEGGEADGWDRAQQTLREVADRTGSYSARYWADYLVKDPDRRRPGSASAAPVDAEGEQG